MYKNPLWLGLIACITLITVWYSGNAFYQWYRYNRLQAVANVQEIRWEVKELNSEDYVPFARYTFVTPDGQEFQGEDSYWERYRNAWGAEEDLPKLSQKVKKVWYNPSRPYQSALQKNFPTKECLSALALLALWIYFMGLGYYVARQSLNR